MSGRGDGQPDAVGMHFHPGVVLFTGPQSVVQLHWPSAYAQSSPSGVQSCPFGTAAYDDGHEFCGGQICPLD